MHVDAQESRLTIIPFQNLPIKRWYEDCISVISKYKLANFYRVRDWRSYKHDNYEKKRRRWDKQNQILGVIIACFQSFPKIAWVALVTWEIFGKILKSINCCLNNKKACA